MYAYQQQPQTTSARGGIDIAAWALVAIVVAAICAGAGWAIARSGVVTHGDLQRGASLAAREGAARGMSAGFSQGAEAGRQETKLRAQIQGETQRQQAQTEGWNAGFEDGRSRAIARAEGYTSSTGLTSAGSYPGLDYSDVLGNGMFGDVPGYSTSVFSDLGYGNNVATPYPSSSVLSSTGLGY